MDTLRTSTTFPVFQRAVRIDDASGVGAARRHAAKITHELAFQPTRAGEVALAVTELGTNIVKHARRGELLLRPISRSGKLGLELLALDQGPGMANPAQSMRDGHSTAGSAGTGLGALTRLSRSFQLYSYPDRGTAIRLEMWADDQPLPGPDAPIELGAVCLPKRGEGISGDDWEVRAHRAGASVLIADGLGHGPDARAAATLATAQLREHPEASPPVLMRFCHAALAQTRGAAVAAAQLDTARSAGVFAGVGNIVCRIETPDSTKNLVSHSGIVGHAMRKMQQFEFVLPSAAVLVLHTDGLASNWSLSSYPGLLARHPGLIAGVLYRDYDRGRDDVTVVVVRPAGQTENKA